MSGDSISYDPAADGYDLAKDPSCLFGWGPPSHGCIHRFGHGCFRPLGHKGLCSENPGEHHYDKCETVQRPKDWDTIGRTEANT